MAFSIGQIIGAIIAGIIVAAISALIGAMAVRFATNVVAKFVPPFGMAYKALFTGVAVSYLIGLLFGAIFRGSISAFNNTSYILLTIIGFLVATVILGSMIKDTVGVSIGFKKACIINLIQLIFTATVVGSMGFLLKAIIN